VLTPQHASTTAANACVSAAMATSIGKASDGTARGPCPVPRTLFRLVSRHLAPVLRGRYCGLRLGTR
jgi:hypothetical protein